MRKSIFYLFSAVILLFSSCQESAKTIKKIDRRFTDYIEAFTSGRVSNKTEIHIVFAENPTMANMNMDPNDLFELIPEVQGDMKWKSEKELVFTPKEKLKSGELYEVKFKLGELTEVPNELKEFKFNFSTIENALKVKMDGVHSIGSRKEGISAMKFIVETADYMDQNEIEKNLKAVHNEEELKVHWKHLDNGLLHELWVDSLHRDKAPKAIEIVINDKKLGLNEKPEDYRVLLPSLGDFKLLKVEPAEEGKNYVRLLFSDPVDPIQDLRGIIYTDGKNKLKFEVDGNEVQVIPVNKIQGKTKLTVSKSVKSYDGKSLVASFSTSVGFEEEKPQVKLIGKGVIIPTSDGLKFPFKAINVNGVHVRITKIFENNVHQFLQNNNLNGNSQLSRVGRVVHQSVIDLKTKGTDLKKWNTYALDLEDFIKPEPGAIYQVQMYCDPSQSIMDCADNSFKLEDMTSFNKYTNYDGAQRDYYSYYDYDYGLGYSWSQKDNPCDISYYIKRRNDAKRNVLASNIGVLAKSADGKKWNIAVTDLRTTIPIENAKVYIYNYQNQLLQEVITDVNGFIQTSLKDRPYLIEVHQGEERGYLKVNEGESLSLSMFDVAGIYLQEGVKGFIYGERGVWRPGDSIYLSFMLEDKEKTLPKGIPVTMELKDPKGNIVSRITKTEGVSGLYDFRTATASEAITGNYRAKVTVGNRTFSKRVKVEMVKPNRLKIDLDFPGEYLSVRPGGQAIKLHSEWLHGAKARNLDVTIERILTKTRTSFDNYSQYIFDDPSKSFYADKEQIVKSKLDSEGNMSFDAGIPFNSSAPGMLNALFKVKVFETGGGFSIRNKSIKYSPYTDYIGINVPEQRGGGGFKPNTKVTFPICAVSSDGKLVNKTGLKVKVYKIDWRWWWQSGGDYLGRYVNSSSNALVYETEINLQGGKGKVEMDLPNQYGRFMVRVEDPVGGHSTGSIFYVDYPYWYDEEDRPDAGAAILDFKMDKQEYKVGETVSATFNSSAGSRVLISLENGREIVDQFWSETEDDKTTVSFKVTEEMMPNIYLNLTYLQPHAQTNSNLPIRLYGVKSIGVKDDKHFLEPMIKAPEKVRPEKEFTVEVKEKAGKQMAYTLAIVDEGLLDLTNFQTPSPYDYFYGREALGVNTWDMYGDVLGAYSGKIAGLFKIGGDEDKKGKGKNNLNRFKPVVKFLGPFFLEEGAKDVHKITLPNYIGRVKVMVVAGHELSYGNAEKSMFVSKPLMVQATFPRVLGPKEQVSLPVTVFAMEDKVGEVKLSLKDNGYLRFIDGRNKTVVLNKQGQKTVYFNVEVKDKVGVGKVSLTANSSKENSYEETELLIRNGNPLMTELDVIDIEPSQSESYTVSPLGTVGTNSSRIEVSVLPPMDITKRLEYLVAYPHGCIEQTTSRVFPQLFLSELTNLDDKTVEEITKNVGAGIDRIKLFQTSNGGFSYWPGDSYESEWASIYVTHFLTEAKSHGYDVPEHLLGKALSYLEREANSWDNKYNKYNQYNQKLQGYRLYVLALSGYGKIGACNRMKSGGNLFPQAKLFLGMAYYQLGQKATGKKQIEKGVFKMQTYSTSDKTYGSNTRDLALFAIAYNMIGRDDLAQNYIEKIAEKLSSNSWMSTQTTAWSLLAMADYSSGNAMDFKFSISIEGNSSEVTSNKAVWTKNLAPEKAQKINISNATETRLYVRVVRSGRPLTGSEKSYSNKLGMRIRYEDIKGNLVNPLKLTVGTDFFCKITINDYSNMGPIENISLEQVFPSGWEINNSRMLDSDFQNKQATYDYLDIRDDRVYSYFNLRRGASKMFIVSLTAAYPGKFYQPAFLAEAMYDATITVHNKGKWVEVVSE